MAEDPKAAKEEAKSLRSDDIPEAILVTDARHKIKLANSAALEYLGYRKEEVVGWPLEKIFPELPSGLSTLIAGRSKMVEFTIKAKMRGGRRAILEFMAAPIRRRGRVAGVLYIGRDVRIHSLLESEVKKARNYFRSIVENSPYGMCVTDASRTVMMSNKAVEEILGYDREALVGRPVYVFYPEEEKSEKLDPASLKQRRQRLVRQLQFRRKDGSVVPVKVSYAVVGDLEGSGDIIIESYSDQSDRQRVDQLKNEFVFVAAHELRNPVTAIRLLLDIIFEDKRLALDPLLRGYLAKVQEANERLLRLVDDLLEVSRSEAGRLKIEVTPQPISEHVVSLISEMRPTAVSKGVTLHYAASPGLPMVLADSNKLKEVLTNLVANAIKYNVTGGSVTVTHEVQDGLLVTHVSDTGIGIGPEDQAKLFSKFWRSEDLAVRAQAGTGLGLFIVKELVERMGGKVWAKSQRGKGTTFSFSLPLAK